MVVHFLKFMWHSIPWEWEGKERYGIHYYKFFYSLNLCNKEQLQFLHNSYKKIFNVMCVVIRDLDGHHTCHENFINAQRLRTLGSHLLTAAVYLMIVEVFLFAIQYCIDIQGYKRVTTSKRISILLLYQLATINRLKKAHTSIVYLLTLQIPPKTTCSVQCYNCMGVI